MSVFSEEIFVCKLETYSECACWAHIQGKCNFSRHFRKKNLKCCRKQCERFKNDVKVGYFRCRTLRRLAKSAGTNY